MPVISERTAQIILKGEKIMTVGDLKEVLTLETIVKIFNTDTRGTAYNDTVSSLPTDWDTYTIDFIEVSGFGIKVSCHATTTP